MNSEAFPEQNPDRDKEVVDAIIKGDFEKFGHLVPGKSKEEVLDEDFGQSNLIDQTNEEEEDNNESEIYPDSERWKEEYEKGIYKLLVPTDAENILFEILHQLYPELGIDIQEEPYDMNGMPQEGVRGVYLNDPKSKEIINKLLDNPIIELLCSPISSRFTFDRCFERVRANSMLPREDLEKFKAYYLYKHHKFLLDHAASEKELNNVEEEIFKIKPRAMTDNELLNLFQNVIREELGY